MTLFDKTLYFIVVFEMISGRFVYSQIYQQYYQINENKSVTTEFAQVNVISTVSAKESKLTCISECNKNSSCQTVLYNTINETCTLFKSVFYKSGTIDMPGQSIYTKEGTGKT